MKRNSGDTIVSLLNTGTQFTGNIESQDDLCIHGWVSGSINACKKLIIGVTAQIEGDITSPCVAVFGEVKGNIFSSGFVSLKNTSRVTGTIRTVQIEIESGAEFNGDCCIEQVCECVS